MTTHNNNKMLRTTVTDDQSTRTGSLCHTNLIADLDKSSLVVYLCVDNLLPLELPVKYVRVEERRSTFGTPSRTQTPELTCPVETPNRVYSFFSVSDHSGRPIVAASN